MAVESFLQPSEAKIVVEKKVKEKPSLKELTTVETPGRDVNVKVKQKRKTKKSLELEQKREWTLIVTEKPQAALKIASALGNPKKYSEDRVPYYELTRDGKKIVVASTVGHLFNLTYSKGQTGWPVFKIEWVPAYLKSSFTRNYYNVLKKLERKSKEFIIATDYDIEGEVIGWNVLRFLLKQKDAKRMKFSTLTKNELERAFNNPLQTMDWGQAYAGETRHIVDWLYGINLSRALMSAIKKADAFRILSIGRVQGPALKIIADREREISNFKSEPYWNVIAKAKGIDFHHPKDIFDKEELKQFENIKEGFVETQNKEESIEPPHPFDLTTLQREAYNLHKISPSGTLRTAQSLYLSGLISYPRTSSQKIPSEIEPKRILKELAKNFKEVKHATRNSPIEGPKSDPAHPSIYPTGEFENLEGEQKKIYELIVKRFIAAFSENAIVSRKRLTLTADGKKFTASASNIKEKGWMNVYFYPLEERTLPDINGKVNIDEIKTLEKETQPPKRYTPASLVSLLEKRNLGTKTTRSMIVDTLFDRGYLDGKSIQATPLGMKLIESLEKYSPIIIDENLTRDLEDKMEKILEAKEGFLEKENQITENVERLINDISKEFKIHEREIGQSLVEGSQELRELQKENSKIMPCPVCKQGTLTLRYSKKTRKQFIGCDRYPECTATYSVPPNALIKKTDKTSPEGLPILVALRKGKRPWEFPFNPNWKKENQA